MLNQWCIKLSVWHIQFNYVTSINKLKLTRRSGHEYRMYCALVQCTTGGYILICKHKTYDNKAIMS